LSGEHTSASPLVGSNSPVIVRNVVDLPAPFTPINPKARPLSAPKVTPLTASVPFGYTFFTSLSTTESCICDPLGSLCSSLNTRLRSALTSSSSFSGADTLELIMYERIIEVIRAPYRS